MLRIINSLIRRFRSSLKKHFQRSDSNSKSPKHRPKIRLFLINEFYGSRTYVTDMLDNVAVSLSHRGIHVKLADRIHSIATKVRRRDLVISHQIPTRGTPLPCSHFHGTLKTHRARGLQLLKKHGIDTVRWFTPANRIELMRLFDLWRTNTLLLKRANTCKALGISIIKKSDVESLNWGSHDVFCEILLGNPRTIKVHFLGPTVLGSYFIETPPVSDLPKLVEFLEPFPTPEGEELQIYIAKGIHNRVQMDPVLAEKISVLGSKLFRLGGGYSSIDFMEGPDGWLAIELNSNTVGTLRPWVTWPQEHHETLVNALEAVVFMHARRHRKAAGRKQTTAKEQNGSKPPIHKTRA